MRVSDFPVQSRIIIRFYQSFLRRQPGEPQNTQCFLFYHGSIFWHQKLCLIAESAAMGLGGDGPLLPQSRSILAADVLSVYTCHSRGAGCRWAMVGAGGVGGYSMPASPPLPLLTQMPVPAYVPPDASSSHL